ncbi:MAG: CHAT domain-containing protein [Anaerolineae bacterium]|nr:CHAT domain-containing protein [Anaerolineae bacterium]
MANLLFGERRYALVVDPYRLAMQATDTLLQASLVRGSKEVELREIQGLPANAAYALAQLGRLEDAVVALEQGRTRLLAEALEQSRRDLERLPALGHGDLYERYRAASDRLAVLQQQAGQPAGAGPDHPAGPRDYAAWRQELEAARRDLDETIAAIRSVSVDGQQPYADFLLPPTFARIAAAVQPGVPLIYLLTTEPGGLALFVRRETAADAVAVVTAAPLGLTAPALRALLMGPADDPALGGYLGAYSAWVRDARNPAKRQAWYDQLEQTTRDLGDKVMGPVVAHLQSLGARQAVLIPSGLLALLPLHAAWTQPDGRRRYALDDLTLTYAPSAGALQHARELAGQTRDLRLLAVDEPQPVAANRLPNSAAEVAAIGALFADPTVLHHGEARREAVLAALPAAQVVHFSCHGANNWQKPLQSGLVMAHDDLLTVADVLALCRAGARLATLSACETGIVGADLPDEVVALPAALTQAGFAGVVASLWSVADVSTAMLMERFYRLWRQEGLPPGEALAAAQRWLRDTTNQEKADYFGHDIPDLDGARMPQAIAADFFEQVAERHQQEQSFEHPFWWAAFYLTGV